MVHRISGQFPLGIILKELLFIAMAFTEETFTLRQKCQIASWMEETSNVKYAQQRFKEKYPSSPSPKNYFVRKIYKNFKETGSVHGAKKLPAGGNVEGGHNSRYAYIELLQLLSRQNFIHGQNTDAENISEYRQNVRNEGTGQSVEITIDGENELDEMPGRSTDTGTGSFEGTGQNAGTGSIKGTGQNAGTGSIEGSGQNARTGLIEGSGQNARTGLIEGSGQNAGTGSIEGTGQNAGTGSIEGSGQNARTGLIEGSGQNAGTGSIEGSGQNARTGLIEGSGQNAGTGSIEGSGQNARTGSIEGSGQNAGTGSVEGSGLNALFEDTASSEIQKAIIELLTNYADKKKKNK